MTYLLDSDVFIQAKNRHYGFDIVPGFWEWLVTANADGVLYSVERVAQELREGADELADWVGDRDASFFLPPDDAVVNGLAATIEWANGCGLYDPAAVATFAQAADYYLIGHAHAHGHVVVTHEVPANSRTKIKIPNACDGMGVQWTTPFEMLRAAGARFVVGP